jgi:ParB-like chromosome segregation protein Spo0J
MRFAPRYQFLPPLPPDQRQALKDDIAANGIQVPVLRDEDGSTLDSHHREAIAKELGIK